MILQSLADYYEILNKSGVISKPGYSKVNVTFALNISDSGDLLSIRSLKNSVIRGKKSVEVPQSMQMPEQVKKTVNIQSNFLCDNATYFLGLDSKGNPERAKQCFDAAKKLHLDLLEGLDSVEARAVVAFFNKWNPEQLDENAVIAEWRDQLSTGANIIFLIEGYGYLHECREVLAVWDDMSSRKDNSNSMQCLVTGKQLPVARLHGSIKGIAGAQAMGVSLVSFNDASDWSYGKDKLQGLNAPVSEYAAFAYTTALNYLLADRNRRCTIGDTTIVYWAESDKPIYRDMFGFAIDPINETNVDASVMEENESAAALVKNIFSKIVNGLPLADVEDVFEINTRFCVLGLSPNAGRLSVRFFLRDSFGAFIDNIAEHYRNLEIEKAPFEPHLLPVWKLMLETVSPKSKDKASSPLLTGSVMRSVLLGLPYPAALYNNVFVRIRADREISYGKAAIIKACLIRKLGVNEQTEVLSVSLNENSTNKSYVLGRLFAILEKLQQEANPGINATIKDRYFASACATPGSVFPVLLRLSSHHSAKAQYGYTYDNKIRDLLDKIDMDGTPFPAHLTLDQQGVFVLGYYHQYQANYKKAAKEEERK